MWPSKRLEGIRRRNRNLSAKLPPKDALGPCLADGSLRRPMALQSRDGCRAGSEPEPFEDAPEAFVPSALLDHKGPGWWRGWGGGFSYFVYFGLTPASLTAAQKEPCVSSHPSSRPNAVQGKIFH